MNHKEKQHRYQIIGAVSAIDSLVFSKIKSDLFPVLAVKEKFDLEGKKQQAKEYIASLMKPILDHRKTAVYYCCDTAVIIG